MSSSNISWSAPQNIINVLSVCSKPAWGYQHCTIREWIIAPLCFSLFSTFVCLLIQVIRLSSMNNIFPHPTCLVTYILAVPVLSEISIAVFVWPWLWRWPSFDPCIINLAILITHVLLVEPSSYSRTRVSLMSVDNNQQKRSSGIFGSSTSINSTAFEPVNRKGNIVTVHILLCF